MLLASSRQRRMMSYPSWRVRVAMAQRCCSIHLEQCVHHPMCIELVTRRCDKVFLGMEQFLRREALLTSRDVVAAIEVTITGPNARVHSSHRCCMPAHFEASHSVNMRR